MNIYKYMMVAKEESLKSNYKHKLGSVIISGNRILSTGYNQIRHSKVGKRFAPWENSLHAERAACIKVDKEKLKGSYIFVYREFATGLSALAMPCEDCMNMIISLGIKRVYFSTNQFPYYGEIRL